MPKTDQFFKALVREFLPELLRAFLPGDARHLDFRTLRFLGTEVYTSWPAGLPRDVDVLAEVKTLEGDPEIVAVHIEIQAQRQAEFGERMWEYYMALRLTQRKHVLARLATRFTPRTGAERRGLYSN